MDSQQQLDQCTVVSLHLKRLANAVRPVAIFRNQVMKIIGTKSPQIALQTLPLIPTLSSSSLISRPVQWVTNSISLSNSHRP